MYAEAAHIRGKQDPAAAKVRGLAPESSVPADCKQTAPPPRVGRSGVRAVWRVALSGAERRASGVPRGCQRTYPAARPPVYMHWVDRWVLVSATSTNQCQTTSHAASTRWRPACTAWRQHPRASAKSDLRGPPPDCDQKRLRGVRAQRACGTHLHACRRIEHWAGRSSSRVVEQPPRPPPPEGTGAGTTANS